jgi:hypothetical protein
VESMAIHSRRVEPALIPYVMTPIITTTSEDNAQFFFFLGRKEMMTTVKPHNLTMNTMHADQAMDNNDSTP